MLLPSTDLSGGVLQFLHGGRHIDYWWIANFLVAEWVVLILVSTYLWSIINSTTGTLLCPRFTKPLSVTKPVGTGFVENRENRKNRSKTGQNSIFENVQLETRFGPVNRPVLPVYRPVLPVYRPVSERLRFVTKKLINDLKMPEVFCMTFANRIE